jgi:hypothetical protein
MYMFCSVSRGRFALALSSVALLGLVCVPVLLACSTPVYRYAMYRWESAPYEVYYFHDQEAGEADQKIAQVLKDTWESREERANVLYIPVNVVEDKELKRIPPDVKQHFLSRENPTLPTYLISTPYGAEIFYGKLEEKTLPAMIDSPARTQLAEQLAEGRLGVLLFLTCSDKAANEAAEKVLQGLVQEVKKGEIEFYMPPPFGPMPGAPEGEEAPQTPALELGYLKVKRDDPKEEWLVRQLLAMEPDLKDEDSPMVFMCYGRGRALLPYVGKGISRENLLYELEFVTGACSCTVKEQNPGVDLLVRHDWEAAAVALAEKYSADEGNPYGPGMFFPELVIPSAGGDEPVDDVAAEESEEMTDATSPDEPAEPTESDATADEEVAVAAADTPPATETDAADAAPAVETSESTDPNEPSEDLGTVGGEQDQAPLEPSPTEDDSEPVEADAETTPASEAEPESEPAAAPETTEEASTDEPAPESAEEATAATEPQASPGTAVADAGTTVSGESSGGQADIQGGTLISVWVVGVGVLLALAALFGITFFVLRPQ